MNVVERRNLIEDLNQLNIDLTGSGLSNKDIKSLYAEDVQRLHALIDGKKREVAHDMSMSELEEVYYIEPHGFVSSY